MWANLKDKCQSMSYWSFIFIFVSFINYISLAAIAIYTASQQGKDINSAYSISRLFIYFTIILFQLSHAYAGLFKDNIYELCATMVTQIFVTALVILHSAIIPSNKWTPYDYVEAVYGGFFQIVYLVFAYPLYKEFQRNFFSTVGGDMEIRKRHRRVLKLQALLKIDLMICIVNALSYGAIIGEIEEFYWLMATFDILYALIAICHFVVGKFGHKNESFPTTVTYWCLSTISPAIIAYGIYHLESQGLLNFSNLHINNLRTDKYLFSAIFLVSGVIQLVIRVLSIMQSIVVYKQFGLSIGAIQSNRAHKEEYDALFAVTAAQNAKASHRVSLSIPVQPKPPENDDEVFKVSI